MNELVTENETKKNSVWTIPLIITMFIALVSLFFTGWVFIDTNFVSKVDVNAGRQIRLFVAFGDEKQEKPQPCIMMTVSYTNHGGKVVAVFDTKLNVKWLCENKIVLEREFKALRELDNFLMAEGKFPQYPISTVVVPGKTNEVRCYVFTPYVTVEQEDIPKGFDLVIEVYTQIMNKWSLKSKYRVLNVSDVWQDLKAGLTFNAKVLDIEEIK